MLLLSKLVGRAGSAPASRFCDQFLDPFGFRRLLLRSDRREEKFQ
jgi:hypothetical protein